MSEIYSNDVACCLIRPTVLLWRYSSDGTRQILETPSALHFAWRASVEDPYSQCSEHIDLIWIFNYGQVHLRPCNENEFDHDDAELIRLFAKATVGTSGCSSNALVSREYIVSTHIVPKHYSSISSLFCFLHLLRMLYNLFCFYCQLIIISCSRSKSLRLWFRSANFVAQTQGPERVQIESKESAKRMQKPNSLSTHSSAARWMAFI